MKHYGNLGVRVWPCGGNIRSRGWLVLLVLFVVRDDDKLGRCGRNNEQRGEGKQWTGKTKQKQNPFK